MARRVYFGFDYEDVKTFRANVVRNHDVIKKNYDAVGFVDASIWEETERHGADAVKRLINSNLENTSVTCILIGSRTWSRRWVRYEIMKSYERGNTLFGVHINGIRDKNQQTFPQGPNPFDFLGFFVEQSGLGHTLFERDDATWREYADLRPVSLTFLQSSWNRGHTLSTWVPCFDWVTGEGYKNFPAWVDSAR